MLVSYVNVGLKACFPVALNIFVRFWSELLDTDCIALNLDGVLETTSIS